ncbi:MAG: hypothetical protein KQH63_01185 [Desulfobulbaceae bacterium]|nr:hypothetical protein [Desulfobulbaceae bacterium]
MGMRFSFICALEQAGKMDRVIAYADGRVISKQRTPVGAIYVVEKT